MVDPTLPAGTRLGAYEIVGTLGTGGMGYVYRARDHRLGRDVAIKVSREQFSARFEREARLIASLNHPNICTLYDVGPSYLVMELVDGKSPRGPLPFATAIDYARQIAAALETAHEKGIVHRDLKPANIKINSQGILKVLDFGLAKAIESSGPSDDAVTTHATETALGTIVGTPAYMSPEQAAGRPVDKRTDIWAFGAVLYELLIGTRAFAGDSVQETLAAVLKETPDWSAVPLEARPLLQLCLEKDPSRRLRDIGDAMALVSKGANDAPVRARRRWIWPVTAGVAAVLAAIAVWAPWRPPASEPALTRFSISAPKDSDFRFYVSVSPDGHRVAFTAQGIDSRMRVWVRDMDSLDGKPLPGTEITTGYGSPFWSPDGKFIAFADGETLKKIDASGASAPVTIGRTPGDPIAFGTWNSDGDILFGSRNLFTGTTDTPIWHVAAAGGDPTLVPFPGKRRLGMPAFLPDGRHFLYVEQMADGYAVYAGALDAAPEQQPVTPLLKSNSQVIYAASGKGGTGHLIFTREETLFAQTFDSSRLSLAGEPIPLATHVMISPARTGYGYFSASQEGTLAYRRQGGMQLTWFDRRGHTLQPLAAADFFGALRISPDGSRGALDFNNDIWLIDFAPGNTIRFTSGAGVDSLPFWSRDGKRIVFRSFRQGKFGFYEKAADGTGSERLLWETPKERWIDDLSLDGRLMLFNDYGPNGDVDLWVLPLEGERQPVVLLQTPATEEWVQFSPDDRLIAYDSDETGRRQVYISSFSMSPSGRPVLGPRLQVSNNGGERALWRKDGKELVYLGPGGRLYAAQVVQSDPPRTDAPVDLFQFPTIFNSRLFAIDPAAERVLAPSPLETMNEIVITLNWPKMLKR